VTAAHALPIAAAPEVRPYRLTLVRIVEGSTVVFLLFLLSSALIGPLLDPRQLGGDTNPILRLMWLPAYGLIFGLTVLRTPHLLRYWFPALLLAGLVGLAFASTQWSIDPATSFRRSIAVAFTTLFGLYLAASFTPRAMAELLAITFLGLAVGSFAVSVAVPSLGVHSDVNAGAWKGLWYEKNQMGAIMVYGALSALAAAITTPKRRWLWIGTIGLCTFLMLMTRSKTSLLCLMLVLGGAAGLAVVGRGAATAVLAVWAGVTAAAAFGGMMLFAPDVLFEMLGKDPSLTGRTDIWAAVMRQSDKSPTLGFGFAAFWGLQSAPAEWVRANTGWLVPTAHNGWLDLLVQLGWVGVTAMAVVLGLATLAAIWRFRVEGDGYWAILYLAVFLLQSASESFLLQQNSLAWVFAALAISRVLGPLPHREPPATRPAPHRTRPPLAHGASPSWG